MRSAECGTARRAALFRTPNSALRNRESQGDHGACGANCRCCLPALAGFVSPHSMGPGQIVVEAKPRVLIAARNKWPEFAPATAIDKVWQTVAADVRRRSFSRKCA